MLKKIIENQEKFQKEVDKHEYEFTGTKDMVMSYMAAIVGETDEVNKEVNYKWWKKPKTINKGRLHEELADIFIFWLDLCMRLGIMDKIFKVIEGQQAENLARQKGLVKGREDYKA